MSKHKYNKYLHKLNKLFNPPIKIIPEKLKDGRTFNVIRDDFLIGGTKQRMIAALILANPDCNEFVYAGPHQGYAQVALGYVAKLMGKKATLFLSDKSDLTRIAEKYNPKIQSYFSKQHRRPCGWQSH